jgi:hypothetical protein
VAVEGQATAKELNLQARFEQLESGLNEAHSIVSQMTPRDGDKSPEEAHEATATAAGEKCQALVHDLINRLQGLRDRVGTV